MKKFYTYQLRRYQDIYELHGKKFDGRSETACFVRNLVKDVPLEIIREITSTRDGRQMQWFATTGSSWKQRIRRQSRYQC